MSKRALVIDDDDLLRKVVARVLQRLPVDAPSSVDTAIDGPSAVALLEEHDDYELVITDNIMPNTDFGALVTAILSHPAQPAFVVIGGALDYAPPPANPRLVLLPLPATPPAISQAIADARARRA